MGLFSKLFGPKADFGKLDPNDATAFWQLATQLNQTQGAARSALLAQYGIKDDAQWNQIVVALSAKHGQNPAAFSAAAYQVSAQQTQAAMAAATGGASLGGGEAIGGLTLQQLATIDAKLESNPAALPQLAAQFGTTPDAYQAAKAGWTKKLDYTGPNPVEAATLNGHYQMFLAQAKMNG
jgi:hypothetical protein